MTPWQWWATSAASRDDGEWELGEFDSQEKAVSAGNLKYAVGEAFYVVEARTSTEAKYASGNFEIVPFVKTRSLERLIASADTHAKRGDVEQAPSLMGSAVTPKAGDAQ